MSKRLPVVQGRDLSGKIYWRSLAERDGTLPADVLAQEFPEGASEVTENETGIGRRGFMGIMGASMALASIAGCRRPEDHIVPYAKPPEEVVPGIPLQFATSVQLYGTAIGLLVESHEGRPTKIEGNPKHPECPGGGSTTFLQGLLLDMYDPDRSVSPREKGTVKTWDDAAAALKALGDKLKAEGGKGLAIVTDQHRSPTLKAALAELKAAMPAAKVVRYEPFDRTNAHEGARIAFGKPLEAVYEIGKAKVIVAVDSDFLMNEGSPVKASRQFAEARSVHGVARVWAIESAFSVTGGNADHRLRTKSANVGAVVSAVAKELGVVDAANLKGTLDDKANKFVKALAKDLAANKGHSVLVVGNGQPPAVHAAVAAINAALENIGKTVSYLPLFDDAPEGPKALVELAKQIGSGVTTLLILGGNPAYDAPADAAFAKAMASATTVHVGVHYDETAAASTWHLNRAHFLEGFSDLASEDGTLSLVQPLIAPLYDGRTDAEVVHLLLGTKKRAYDLVRDTWKPVLGEADFEKKWRRVLHDGVLIRTADVGVLPEAPKVDGAAVAKAGNEWVAPSGAYEITLNVDAHAYDGRFANNGWLAELPDPMTKLTWGNAAWLSKATAAKLGVVDGELLDLVVGGAKVSVPVTVAPGQAEDSIAVTLGLGRRQSGRVGTKLGWDCYPLFSSATGKIVAGNAAKGGPGLGGEHSYLARTQEHFLMEGRPIIREANVATFKADPKFAEKMSDPHPALEALWYPFPYQGHKWGMVTDLQSCTGCNACMIACQAENNVPLVGVRGVQKSREMHWLRMDRYFEGDQADPKSITMPMTCQQCENAPCEQVCPVGATVHTPEGSNDMAYNRCIGTRYCANNCPFKVRRFNFFNYTKDTPATVQMAMNPEVSVRARGVMEKCSWCAQRINRAKIDAKKSYPDGRIRDGEIVTACQQACPTGAITFGDLNDPKSRVAALAADSRNYVLLEELNIRPRLSYLAKVTNPHPDLGDASAKVVGEHAAAPGSHAPAGGHAPAGSNVPSHPAGKEEHK